MKIKHLYVPNESDAGGNMHQGPMICGAAPRIGGQYPMVIHTVELVEGYSWCPKCVERLPMAKLAQMDLGAPQAPRDPPGHKEVICPEHEAAVKKALEYDFT